MKENVIPLIILFAGILITLFGIFMVWKSSVFYINGSITKGTIISFNEKYNRTDSKVNRRLIYAPIIEFLNKEGKKQTFESPNYFEKNTYHINQTVELLISEFYPFKRLYKFKSIWLYPLFYFFFGLIIFWMGYSRLNT